MKAKLLTSLALVVGLLALCSPIFAHHGSAAYDNTKLVVLKNATVTKGAHIGRTGKVVLANGTVFGSGELEGDRASQCDKEFGPGGDEAAACRPDGRKTTNKE